MPKRSNPFGEQSPLQMKTHVGKKEVDMGVAQEERMKSVYERTRSLLFKGSQKAFTDDSDIMVLDANDNITVPSASKSLLPGQMCLDEKGQLTTAQTPSEETESRMTTDEDMAIGISGDCVEIPPPRLPGQLYLDASGHLVTATGVSEEKSNKVDDSTSENSIKKDSAIVKSKAKDACITCRKPVSCVAFSRCRFCEQVKCDGCTRQCSQCAGNYCHLCSVLNYDEAMERSFCLNCS